MAPSRSRGATTTHTSGRKRCGAACSRPGRGEAFNGRLSAQPNSQSAADSPRARLATERRREQAKTRLHFPLAGESTPPRRGRRDSVKRYSYLAISLSIEKLLSLSASLASHKFIVALVDDARRYRVSSTRRCSAHLARATRAARRAARRVRAADPRVAAQARAACRTDCVIRAAASEAVGHVRMPEQLLMQRFSGVRCSRSCARPRSAHAHEARTFAQCRASDELCVALFRRAKLGDRRSNPEQVARDLALGRRLRDVPLARGK